jgi:hypothetical protein
MTMRCYLTPCGLLLSTLMLASCASDQMRTKENLLDDTLRSYASTVRWGDVLRAQEFIDPKLREEHPPTALELARVRQIQVTAYNDQPAVPINSTEVRQTVEIGLVNINTQEARSVIDHQVWKYDEKNKRWWLESGLPDISRRD